MDVLSAVCLNGSQIGDASTDDLNPAATTLIRLARRYPTATWNGPLGKRPLPDALTDVAEKIAPCYPDLGKRLTSAGKQIKP
jgi:hypothetical protein